MRAIQRRRQQVQRRIDDLWRQAAAEVPATVNWAEMYEKLLGELEALSANIAVPDVKESEPKRGQMSYEQPAVGADNLLIQGADFDCPRARS